MIWTFWFQRLFQRTSSLGQVQAVTDLLAVHKHILNSLANSWERARELVVVNSKAFTQATIIMLISWKTVNRYAIETNIHITCIHETAYLAYYTLYYSLCLCGCAASDSFSMCCCSNSYSLGVRSSSVGTHTQCDLMNTGYLIWLLSFLRSISIHFVCTFL